MDQPEPPYPWPARIQLYFRARYFEVTGKTSFDQGLRMASEEALERGQEQQANTTGQGQQTPANEKR